MSTLEASPLSLTYRHENGQESTVDSIEAAQAVCPVAANMTPDQIRAVARLANFGRQTREREEQGKLIDAEVIMEREEQEIVAVPEYESLMSQSIRFFNGQPKTLEETRQRIIEQIIQEPEPELLLAPHKEYFDRITIRTTAVADTTEPKAETQYKPEATTPEIILPAPAPQVKREPFAVPMVLQDRHELTVTTPKETLARPEVGETEIAMPVNLKTSEALSSIVRPKPKRQPTAESKPKRKPAELGLPPYNSFAEVPPAVKLKSVSDEGHTQPTHGRVSGTDAAGYDVGEDFEPSTTAPVTASIEYESSVPESPTEVVTVIAVTPDKPAPYVATPKIAELDTFAKQIIKADFPEITAVRELVNNIVSTVQEHKMELLAPFKNVPEAAKVKIKLVEMVTELLERAGVENAPAIAKHYIYEFVYQDTPLDSAETSGYYDTGMHESLGQFMSFVNDLKQQLTKTILSSLGKLVVRSTTKPNALT